MTIRFSLLTVETDSADPTIMAALRELLERAGAGSVVVSASPGSEPATPAAKHTAIASHLLDASLQELVMEAVQERPGITVPDLASAILNDTTASALTRVRMALAPLCTIGRLLRSKAGGLFTPAAAACSPEFPSKAPAVVAAPAAAPKPCPEFPPCPGCRSGGACVGIVGVDKPARSEPKRKPEPAPAAVDEMSDKVLALVTEKPGLTGRVIAETIFGDTSQGTLIRLGRIATRLMVSGKIERHGFGAAREYFPVGAEPPPQTPARKPRFVDELLDPEPPQHQSEGAPLRVRVARDEKMPVRDPSGRVAGVAPAAVVPGSLSDRIIQTVIAQAGISRDELAVELLGDASSANVRRIDMLLGTLVMSGQLARYNGRVYENVAQAAKLKLPPPKRATDRGWPGAGGAPLAQVQTQKALFDAIVAAFAEDHATPIPDLARELFGDSTGRSVDKLQLMLRQLCASKRLMRLPAGGHRPVDEEESAVESDAEEDDDSDELDEDEEQELISNGQPDDEEPQELEVG